MRTINRTASSMPAKSINSRVKSIQAAEARRLSAMNAKQADKKRIKIALFVLAGLAGIITVLALTFGVQSV